jgi:hypothetical protein
MIKANIHAVKLGPGFEDKLTFATTTTTNAPSTSSNNNGADQLPFPSS